MQLHLTARNFIVLSTVDNEQANNSLTLRAFEMALMM